MTALTPTSQDKYNTKFFAELAEELEKDFPKGECEERGRALVLVAFANIIFRKLISEFEQDIIKLYVKKT